MRSIIKKASPEGEAYFSRWQRFKEFIKSHISMVWLWNIGAFIFTN
jgi:hypothetical protein